jgi:hypothetical protein
MEKSTTRREFLEVAGMVGGCLACCPLARSANGADATPASETALPDFEKLTYCCYECSPKRCPLLKASLGNDLELKRKTAAEWKTKYGRDFSPEEVFCFGCKVEPARQGEMVKRCDVRACVIDRKLISCAHCGELATCPRRLWVDYPKFREHVLGIRKALLAQIAPG